MITTPSQILPRLWLSGLYTAVDEEQLIALGVTHIVSMIEYRPKYPPSLKLKKLHIPIQDVEGADILQHLDVTTAFITSALEDKRNTVLVHCAMGISRSATVVCAYLIAAHAMPPHEALEFVISKREIVWPNPAFQRQLQMYAARFRGRRKLRKIVPLPLPPPMRATVTYSSMSPRTEERFRWMWPESRPIPPPPPMSRRGSLS
ncbi:phosphatases II [Lentinus brumalis]|uniref:Phosphatases II n=1 Tax=Lentinus brumalis TaxID=2498619 RepID=A0A371DFF2_9APHY|nr:phosphatases II [Polyporus brumalis]